MGMMALAILTGCSSTLSQVETNAVAQGEALVVQYQSEITGFLPLVPASSTPVSKP